MTTTTRPVKADLGCARRAISGTAARTTNTTSNAKIEPSSFMAVAHPPSQASGDRRSPLLFFRRAGRLGAAEVARSEEHTSELQSRLHLVCRLLLEKKKKERGSNGVTMKH